jgi:hypothetical protein
MLDQSVFKWQSADGKLQFERISKCDWKVTAGNSEPSNYSVVLFNETEGLLLVSSSNTSRKKYYQLDQDTYSFRLSKSKNELGSIGPGSWNDASSINKLTKSSVEIQDCPFYDNPLGKYSI